MKPDEMGGAGERRDMVNHPRHYRAHPSGVEAIEVCEHLGFNLGNAVKYVMRAPYKGSAHEDLQKARWYLSRFLGGGELPLPARANRAVLPIGRILATEPGWSLVRELLGAVLESVVAADPIVARPVLESVLQSLTRAIEKEAP